MIGKSIHATTQLAMRGVPSVLLITGLAAAGKTAVAAEWAATRSYVCAHVSLDDIRWMVKSGYANPQDGWGPKQQIQLELARGSVALLAHRFIQAGIRCVIDDAFFPEWPWELEGAIYHQWARELDGLSHQLVVLLPALEVVLERNKERTGHRLSRSDIELIYMLMRRDLTQTGLSGTWLTLRVTAPSAFQMVSSPMSALPTVVAVWSPIWYCPQAP